MAIRSGEQFVIGLSIGVPGFAPASLSWRVVGIISFPPFGVAVA